MVDIETSNTNSFLKLNIFEKFKYLDLFQKSADTVYHCEPQFNTVTTV